MTGTSMIANVCQGLSLEQTNTNYAGKENQNLDFMDVLSNSKTEFAKSKQFASQSELQGNQAKSQIVDYQAKTAPSKITQAQNETEEEAEDDQTSNLATAIQETILQLMTQQTGVPAQTITEGMKELNLNFSDLQEPGKLAQLMTNLTGTEDMVDLLTSNEFQDLMGQMNQLWNNVAILNPDQNMEQLKELVDQFPGQEQSMNQPELTVDTPLSDPQQEDQKLEPLQANLEVADVYETNQMNPPQKETSADQLTGATPQKQMELPEESNVSENKSVEEGLLKSASLITEEGTQSTTNSEQGTTDEQKQNQEENSLSKLLKENGKLNNQVNDHVASIPQTVTTQQTVLTPEGIQQVDMQSIVDKISELTKTTTNGTISSIQMQLNPEHLGKLLIEVSTSQGEITAKIAAQNETVKQAVEAQTGELKASLEQQGVKVAAVEVTVESHEFERNLDQNQAEKQMQENQQNKQNQSNRRRRNLNLHEMSLNDLSGMMSEEETLMANMMADNGGTLDLNA